MKIRAVLLTFIVIAKLIAFLALTRAVLRSQVDGGDPSE